MNNIATTFSIKDLENLSGIKAHTIRIWEKRYGVLVPERTDTNIRLYNVKNLTKLLNVTFLYNSGFKISKIGKMSDDELNQTIRVQSSKKRDKDHFLDELKLSMIGFNQHLFEKTYNKMLSEMSFRDCFLEVFIPLLEFIGIQWQSDSITPSHEHFISSLITQKLLINIERVQQSEPVKDKVFVLFLPDGEIHELGLLYLNYELSVEGYQTVYLGTSVPTSSLISITDTFTNVDFISYFTVKPTKDEVDEYLKNFEKEILSKHKSNFYVLGRIAETSTFKGDNVKMFKKIDELINKI